MKNFVCILFLSVIVACSGCATYSAADAVNEPTGVTLSQRLLQEKKAGKDGQSTVTALAELDVNKLAAELDQKDEKLAFWVNVYNGMVQYLLDKDPELWDNRSDFFSEALFTIAGQSLSLEDVEHGIIRGGESKLGLGYLPQLFPGRFKRTFKIDGGDARIHFALNCGAIDCPPVEIYDPADIDERLDYRSRIYVNKHSSFSEDGETLITTPLFSWFRGDFGTYDGVDDFLVEFGVLTEENKNINRDYKEYDWTLATDVWAED